MECWSCERGRWSWEKLLELQLSTVEEWLFPYIYIYIYIYIYERRRVVVLPGQAEPPALQAEPSDLQAGNPSRKLVRFCCKVYF